MAKFKAVGRKTIFPSDHLQRGLPRVSYIGTRTLRACFFPSGDCHRSSPFPVLCRCVGINQTRWTVSL